ncbi:hypothetical protein [Chitinophaga pinensis]|uniref:Aminotransferase class I/II-fold pyridoxal phosphate-dependent enzyme n=1 Tax=Chitinophaga pinensis TaxID=79329 RepID=A0A5C6LLV3_9BACT|nr:hypothetical protein [Chitinophaga pinensis]TWV95108.1 hypothetical protein FEF09_24870 [Chitinophaga pinensis]
MYSDSRGSFRLRKALAEHISGSRGIAMTPDMLLLTRGAQMAIYAVAATLIKPGDEYWWESRVTDWQRLYLSSWGLK